VKVVIRPYDVEASGWVAFRACCESGDFSPRGVSILSGHLDGWMGAPGGAHVSEDQLASVPACEGFLEMESVHMRAARQH